MTYKSIPALAAYIDRVGAEELNFKRFIIRDYKGDHYYVERCLIRINADGEISVSNKEYGPTAEERAAIKGALLSHKFPSVVKATPTNVKALRKTLEEEASIYEFVDRKDGGIIMIQQRVMINGAKQYLPWTFWSDGEWRRMEPEGGLPFWKPTHPRGKRRIMVHEGAKTAAFVDALVNDPLQRKALADHPWGETLKDYEHWGMIGGALAPHRSNYGELVKEKPIEVVYVCDNDFPGKSALREVSRCYGHALKGIMFDDRWPMAWDLADPMPPTLFTESGRFIGPQLKELTQLATYATEQIPNPEGKGRPLTVLRKEFIEEWCHAVTPEVFIHRDWPNSIFQSNEFNNRVRPFSDVDDTARLLKMDAASKSAVIKYSPAVKPGIYSDENGRRYINTYIPSPIKAVKGDVSIWLQFMQDLVPNEEERQELLRWCATLIARPENKMLYGVLLISERQGVGKGTLGEKILAPLIGSENVSYPSEQEVVDSAFNYWAAHKRLAVVHEIYAGHSSKAYDKLKSIITDSTITVSKKYQANYEIENWIHIFACSNSPRAIKLSMDDRRWFVPKVTDEKQSADYWVKINRWLREGGGLGHIKWWAGEYLKKVAPVMKGEDAPWSYAKREVIEESYSPGQALVAQFLTRALEEAGSTPTVIIDLDLVRLIRDQIYEGRFNDRIERPLTIRKIAKSLGWFLGKERVQIKEWGTACSFARIITNDPAVAGASGKELAKMGRPLDVAAKASEWLAPI